MILKSMLKKQGMKMWTGFISLGSYDNCSELSGSTKVVEFVHQLSDYQLPKKDAAPYTSFPSTVPTWRRLDDLH
jgi:hypothetical protein